MAIVLRAHRNCQRYQDLLNEIILSKRKMKKWDKESRARNQVWLKDCQKRLNFANMRKYYLNIWNQK